MIGRLKGIIDEYGDDHVIIDVGGVGYEIEAPMTTFYDLPATGSEACPRTAR